MKETIIHVEHVSMHFNLMEEKVDSIKEYFVRLIKGKLLYNDFVALNNVSFEITKGDILGIVGVESVLLFFESFSYVRL